MTSPGFAVDPGGLWNVAPQFSDTADQLSSALSALQGTLDSLGNYWGDDEAGQQYAQNFTGARDGAVKYHTDLVTLFTTTGNVVSGWANTYPNAEQTVVDSM